MSKLTLQDLEAWLQSNPAWSANEQFTALNRAYEFADFADAFAFMTRVALHAQLHDHHPEWSNVYNRVDMRVTTHDVHGLTQRDLELADCAEHAWQQLKPEPGA